MELMVRTMPAVVRPRWRKRARASPRHGGFARDAGPCRLGGS